MKEALPVASCAKLLACVKNIPCDILQAMFAATQETQNAQSKKNALDRAASKLSRLYEAVEGFPAKFMPMFQPR
jgi:hypothetical protein